MELGGGDCMLWYNPESGKIYQAFYYKFNQAVRNENTVIPEVYVLDLQKGEWSKLGNLHVSISSQSGKIKNLAMSPWGLLCFTDFKIFLLSFEKNKIYTLKETAQYKQNLYRAFGNTFFFLDSTLYFTNTKINKLDSIRISLNDFENEGADLYSSSYNYWYITYFVLAALIIAVLFFYLKRKTQKQLFPSNLLLSGSTYLQLEESESEILRLLYENSLANRTTSIDELNKTMGLSKKNTDIQKKQRSDMILSINRKVSLLTNQKEPAIDKQRSDFDKRSFEYFIPVQRIAEVKGLIKEPHPDK
ncbi:MAG: hypothetical protein IPK31_06025 [Chitinophagaceae bacterium]|nr:hypothetical protein [Chitinophagaceae bacterium]